MALTQEQIDALLAPSLKAPQSKPSRSKPTPGEEHQARLRAVGNKGPVRMYDRPTRCVNHLGYHSSGCGTQTYYRLEGKPLCMTHLIDALNKLIIEMTEGKTIFISSGGNSD